MNREVIRIEQEGNKPVEFTRSLMSAGWIHATLKPSEYSKIVYLGKCSEDGDMFAAYGIEGQIRIYKGHLNSGKY